MDASTERHAPKVKNPLEPAEANLRAGMKVYTMHCAQCHGDPHDPVSALGSHEYPPAPQFMGNPADMPEHKNFYIIAHGIRFSAMPGWGQVLTEDESWKVTTFLSHMAKLPPAVEQEWKSSPQPPSP